MKSKMWTKVLSLTVFVLVLQGCDLFSSGGGSNDTVLNTPVAPSTIDNIVGVAYVAPPVDGVTIMDIGEFGTTASAACYVVWNSANSLYCGCRNTADDGQWAQTCTENVDGTTTCPSGTSAASLFAQSVGPARDLTVAEGSLCNALKSATYCSGVRVDGSASPCVPL